MGVLCRLVLAGGVLASLAVPAKAKNPWEALMGRKPKMWSDPKGRFSLDLPVGWTPQPEDDVVRFTRRHPDTGLIAQVQVEIRPLPAGVRAAHFDAHIQADNAARAPGYAARDRQSTIISGRPARQTLFTYRARGNAELAREAVQTVFVDGERGFVVTFEAVAGTREVFWEEFELMLKGFSTGGAPPGNPAPRGRTRIRAGEMVNPNMVGY